MSQNGEHEKESESEDEDKKSSESQESESREIDLERELSSASQLRAPIPSVRRNKPVPYDDERERNYNQTRRSQDDLDLRLPPRYNRGRCRRSDERMPRIFQRENQHLNYSEESSQETASLPYHQGYEGEGSQYDRDFQALTPKSLIDTLLQSPKLQFPILGLVETYYVRPATVRRLVSDFSHIFTVNDDKVLLQPHIKFCEEHLGQTGCRNRVNCKNVHICQKYIADMCNDSGCLFGHKLNTNHNSRIFHYFRIEHLTQTDIKRLLKLSLPAVDTQEILDICKGYNKGECARKNCDALHICQDYITGNLNCGKQSCSLNHNLLSLGCRWLLDRRGIDTNEAPRDILAMLLEVNPTMGELSNDTSDNSLKLNNSHQTVSSVNSSNKVIVQQENNANNSKSSTQNTVNVDESNVTNAVSLNDDNASNITTGTSREDGTSMSSDHRPSLASETRSQSNTATSRDMGNTHVDDGSDSDSNLNNHGANDSPQSSDTITSSGNSTTTAADSNISRQRTTVTSTAPARQGGNEGISRSLWSHHLEGDVRVAEICYDSVENTCPLEANGCPRLHSTRHFHWQVSEESYSWLNLLPNQVLCLEQAFCNPGIDAVTIPALNQQQLDPGMQILFLIMGEESWRANFQGMILVNSDESSILYIRRLSTEIIPGLTVEQSIYHWFYCDTYGVWNEYGETSSEDTHLHYVNSEAIESQYMINPNSFAQFSISDEDHILDFNTMTQINQNNQEATDVRRRPRPHLPFQEEHTTDNLTATTRFKFT